VVDALAVAQEDRAVILICEVGKPGCGVRKACLFELGLVAIVVFNRGDGFVQRDVEDVVELVAGLL
jgi:hypothetical protein